MKEVADERLGIRDPLAQQTRRPLHEHMADFQGSLEDDRVSAGQIKLVTGRVERILDACGFAYPTDLEELRVKSCLAQLRQDGLSDRTVLHYTRAIVQFARFLVKHKRLRDNPFSGLQARRQEVTPRHPRRALSAAEQGRLLEVTRGREPFRGLDGPARALLYRTALQTGLRASELAGLTVADLVLDGDTPMAVLDGSRTKNRKAARQPLPPDLARGLAAWVTGRPGDQRLWPGNWARNKQGGIMLRADLAAAGIPYEVGGRYVDFHGLRHTFVTNLHRAGVSPKVAQTLARHSTIDLTMNVYTDVDSEDLREAIGRTDAMVRSVGSDQAAPQTHQRTPVEFAPEFAPGDVPEVPAMSADVQPTPSGGSQLESTQERHNPLRGQGVVVECPGMSPDVSGGGGIRTHGTGDRFTGFRDRPFQPLRHPSESAAGRPERLLAKNAVRICPASAAIRPDSTRLRWFNRGSSRSR